jgi:hypothetical protein
MRIRRESPLLAAVGTSLKPLSTINSRSYARILSADCLKIPRVGQLTAVSSGLKIKNTVPFFGTNLERLMQGDERSRQRH